MMTCHPSSTENLFPLFPSNILVLILHQAWKLSSSREKTQVLSHISYWTLCSLSGERNSQERQELPRPLALLVRAETISHVENRFYHRISMSLSRDREEKQKQGVLVQTSYHEILVSAQGPMVLGLGLKEFGARA